MYRLLFALGCVSSALAPGQIPQTPEDLIARNLGPRDQVNRAFPPHKIAGNVYYVGSQALATFLITTPEGHILINSSYEATVPVIRAGVEQLGFKMSDVKILLGSHAHADHMEGDAMIKEMSGARVMAMEQDLPALQAMKPGGKAHPIDRVLKDGDTVTLGGVTLTAHLTPGHTIGCTTWTLKTQEGGKTYDVVIVGSAGVNPGVKLVGNSAYPKIAEDFAKTFGILRSLPCDIPLGSHPGMFGMAAKFPNIGKGANPYLDPEGYRIEIDTNSSVFYRTLAAQRKAAGQ